MRSSVLHGHYFNPWNMKNVIVMWRDGRDVMVSWYYYCVFRHELGNERVVKEVRRALSLQNYDDVYSNLPLFIEYAFTKQKKPHFSWTDFVNRWHGRKNIIYVRYEDLKSRPCEELTRVIRELTGRSLSKDRVSAIVEECSFVRQAGRLPGLEKKDSFYRKGIAGDWKNYFSKEAREMFDRYAGEALVRLGYENDNSWVNEDQHLVARASDND